MSSFGSPSKHIAYGTAGFRDKAAVLAPVLYRVALLAALRSRFLGGKTVGAMITASHNPPEDNGAKLIEPLGEMLDQSWEARATALANAPTADLNSVVAGLYTELCVDRHAPSSVMYGRDTRASGPALVAALEAGLQAAGAQAFNAGVVTTPQLHYLVRAHNTLHLPEYESYGVPTQEGYYKKLLAALKKIFSIAGIDYAGPDALLHVVVDCANGVGALKLRALNKTIPFLHIDVVNGDVERPDTLNLDCGADYVKTNQRAPRGIELKTGHCYASFDGDADRVVFYYADAKDGEFGLLDGDKIAVLAARLMSKLAADTGAGFPIGVVQTAYANGASTAYIEDTLGLPVTCTRTGVKHLHHAALKYGIGIYFEANGHGTVLFDPDTVSNLRTLDVSSTSQKKAIDTLLAFSDLINQTVGDAIADLLMVVAILTIQHMTMSQWDALYTDLPNRLRKAAVADRSLFKTTDAERRLVEPVGLQTKLDALVAEYPRGRAFIRASGTEDVVRIYGEAQTQQDADDLTAKVVDLLKPYQ